MKLVYACFLLVITASLPAQDREAPLYSQNETYTYQQLISEYRNLDKKYQTASLIEVGRSDIGKPIHLLVISKEQKLTTDQAKQSGKSILLINNGIHPGEACGIDASLELAKELLEPSSSMHKMLDSTIVLIIPVYNVGGMLNRGSFSRANQNGPKAYGFRGNARNLDLNRDFIKMDSENAKTFTSIFRTWDPDIFVDTHTTNGSDHQYTLTLIASQRDKQNTILAEYMHNEMLGFLYKEMDKKAMSMTPYVYALDRTPENGIKAFLETPRYSSGYATLFNCFSFITEAHVFKPFKDRVLQTKGFLEILLKFSYYNRSTIKAIRGRAKEQVQKQKTFAIQWELDSGKVQEIIFNGYKTRNKQSDVTGKEILFYDKEKPYQKKIPYYPFYKATVSVEKPEYYIIPQAYIDVVDRLERNGVELQRIKNDTLLTVTCYYIENYDTPQRPYEGHYVHSNMSVQKKIEEHSFYSGDFLVSTAQESVRYIIETLEPESVDGFFAWNFFDGILQQKEWFSDYAFEPKAEDLLENSAALKKEFEEQKSNDTSFANNSWAQLYFIYQRSPYYEKSVNRYPVFRIE